MEDQSQPQSDSLDLEMETSERIIQKCGDPGLEEQEAELVETDSNFYFYLKTMFEEDRGPDIVHPRL